MLTIWMIFIKIHFYLHLLNQGSRDRKKIKGLINPTYSCLCFPTPPHHKSAQGPSKGPPNTLYFRCFSQFNINHVNFTLAFRTRLPPGPPRIKNWYHSLWMLEISQWETRIHFPPLSDLSEHSFGISEPKIVKISWNF